MAIVLPALAGVLVVYRGGVRSLTRPGGAPASDDEPMRRGLAWEVGLGGIGAAAGFMAVRAAMLPFAPGIEYHPASYCLGKIPFLLISRPWTLIVSYDPWVPVAAVLCAVGLIVVAHVRVAWPWLLLAMAVIVNVPLLWVWGPHYFCWPAALWAIFNAGLWQDVATRWSDGTLQWRGASSGEAEPPSCAP